MDLILKQKSRLLELIKCTCGCVVCVCVEGGRVGRGGRKKGGDKYLLTVEHLKPAGKLGGRRGASSVFQHLGNLPGKDTTAKVAVDGRLLVDRLLQVQLPTNGQYICMITH